MRKLLAAAFLVVMLCATGAFTYDVAHKFAPSTPIYSAGVDMGGPGGSLEALNSSVYLTFDDGPDPELTPQILGLLAEYGVSATFCVTGENAQRYPWLIKRIVREGHTLCNHSWDHDLEMAAKPAQKVVEDLTATNRSIGYPVKYFRAPGGGFDEQLVRVAATMGMESLYWSVDTEDWSDEREVYDIVKSVKQHTLPGDIILMHDVSTPKTLEAVKELLPWLTEKFKLEAL